VSGKSASGTPANTTCNSPVSDKVVAIRDLTKYSERVGYIISSHVCIITKQTKSRCQASSFNLYGGGTETSSSQDVAAGCPTKTSRNLPSDRKHLGNQVCIYASLSTKNSMTHTGCPTASLSHCSNQMSMPSMVLMQLSKPALLLFFTW
jgi:hypothetical protein